ncbi:MAG: hypothetical protein JW963_13910 [Anaerolineales bacterium]|nr:hypothetical protein [Anaerolineales bacterium]
MILHLLIVAVLDETVKGKDAMDLYPRNSNKPESGEEVGQALIRLIEENMEIERWNFHLSYTKLARPRNIKIIYDSDWCRVKFMFARAHYPDTDEISIEYGRLHAPNEEAFMLWNGEGCRCWHSVLDPLRFLDRLTPAQAYKQAIMDNRLPPALRDFRSSNYWKKLQGEYAPKATIVTHSILWEHYQGKLFELFDLRRPELWEEYRDFLKEYYALLGLKSDYGVPFDYVC